MYSEEEDITTTPPTTTTKYANQKLFKIPSNAFYKQKHFQNTNAVTGLLLLSSFFSLLFVTVRNVLFLTIFGDNGQYNLYTKKEKKTFVSYRYIFVYTAHILLVYITITIQFYKFYINNTVACTRLALAEYILCTY